MIWKNKSKTAFEVEVFVFTNWIKKLNMKNMDTTTVCVEPCSYSNFSLYIFNSSLKNQVTEKFDIESLLNRFFWFYKI